MDTTSTKTSGCNLYILISLLMAGLIIVCMLVMSSKANSYALSAADVQPKENAFMRIEGVLSQINYAHQDANLCDRGVCFHAFLPQNTMPPQNKRIIAEGTFRGKDFHITKLLTRCDHGQK